MQAVLPIAGLGSILVALAGGHLYLTRLEDEVSGGAKIPILVVAKDVAAGTRLSQQQLVVRDIPEAYLDGRAVRASDAKRVVGSRLSVGLKAQQSLLWSDLTNYVDQGKVLSNAISQGMRAVAIEGKILDFDGLLRPGDRVDVLFTAVDIGSSGKSTVTLLQNLLVLSVGGSMERGDGAEGERPRRSFGQGVTVGATLAQAQILIQAKTRGQLTLTLRNPDDVKLVEGLPHTTDQDITETDVSGMVGAATRRKN